MTGDKGEIVERVNGATGGVDGDQEVSVGAAEMAEAARMLRELLDACRPYERAERATGQRLEGAAAALAVLADQAGPP